MSHGLTFALLLFHLDYFINVQGLGCYNFYLPIKSFQNRLVCHLGYQRDVCQQLQKQI